MSPISLIVTLAASALLGGIAAYLLVRRPPPPYWPGLLFLQLAALGYLIGDAITRTTRSGPWRMAGLDLTYGGAFLGSVCFFELAVRSASLAGLRLPRPRVLVRLSWAIFWLAMAMLVTNPLHGRYLSLGAGTGPFGPLWLPTYVVLLGGLWTPATVLLSVLALSNGSRALRASSTVLLAGILLLLGPAVYAAWTVQQHSFDPTVFGITSMAVLLAVGIYRANLFHLLPGVIPSMVEQSTDPVLVGDAEGRIAYANKAARALLGGRNPLGAELAPKLIECLDLEAEGMEVDADSLEGSLRLSVIRRAGTTVRMLPTRETPPRWFSVEPTVVQGPRQTSLVAVQLKDCTTIRQQQSDLEQSERRFRRVLDEAPLGIMACDASGRIFVLNPAMLRLLGSPSLESSMRMNVLESAPIKAVEVDRLIRRCLEEKRSLTTETDYESHWKKAVRVRLHLQPIDDPVHGPGVLMMVEDVTEQRRAERQRRELERTLLETQKLESLGVLAGGIAHDFNNVLTAVKGHAELGLLIAGSDSPLARHLEPILEVSRHAAGLVAQILAYSGRAPARRVAIDLSDLTVEMEALLSKIVARQVPLEIAIEQDLPRIFADAGQTRQILLNLLINAAEAQQGQPGSIRLEIGSGEAASSPPAGLVLDGDALRRRHVYVRVSDHGVGMSPSFAQRIFEPFFTSKGSGRGLGLAATIGVVRAHTGALSLITEEGRGTTVTVFLPVAVTRYPDSAHRKTLLLVDRDPAVRDLARGALETPERSVITAGSIEAALAALDRDQTLTTVVLEAELAGEELGERLVARSLPLVLVGEALPPWLADSRARLLRKPFTASELLAMVNVAQTA